MGALDNIPQNIQYIIYAVVGLFVLGVFIAIFFSQSNSPLGNVGRNVNNFFTELLADGLLGRIGKQIGRLAGHIVGRVLFFIILALVFLFSADQLWLNGAIANFFIRLLT